MGVLAVPSLVRVHGLSMVQLLSDYGGFLIPQIERRSSSHPKSSTTTAILTTERHVQISEVTPRGKEFLFFSLFNIIGKASSFVGPVISGAIIDAMPSHNNSAPFYFLTALSAVSFGIIFFHVDLKRSRVEQEEFLNDEGRARLELERRRAKDP